MKRPTRSGIPPDDPALGASLALEQRAHDGFYGQRPRYQSDDTGTLRFSKEIYEESMAYPWQRRFDLYSEERLRFVKHVDRLRFREGLRDGLVLEYGCGRGDFSSYLALTGSPEVHGFDLSEQGPCFGQSLARACGVAERVHLRQMNAMALDYPDGTFPLVIGFGVLHHIAKYPGTAAELHRVMKPGGHAAFLENLGNGPLWRLIRRTTMGRTDFGDINLTSGYLRRWAAPFRQVRVRGFHLLFMAKRFCFIREERKDGTTREGRRFLEPLWTAIRLALAGCYAVDEVFVNHTTLGNLLGGMCIITLRK